MLHEFITQHRGEILDRCLRDLQYKYPNRGEGELIDAIPHFVDELTLALRRDAGRSGEAAAPATLGKTIAPDHGRLRQVQGFGLDRVVHDFGLVCEAVTATVLKHGHNPNPREYQILNRCVDEGIALAVESFAALARSEDEKRKAEDLGFLAHEIRNAVSNAAVGFDLVRRGKAPADGATAEVIRRSLAQVRTLVEATLV